MIYDTRYNTYGSTRYKKDGGVSSEREILRPLINIAGYKGGNNMKYNHNNPPLICMMTNSTCYKGTRPMEIKGILWHSTGVNNPNLKRYVQPSKTDGNYNKLLEILGVNQYGNDWNHIVRQAGLNAWIGKLANGEVAAVQTMPWEYRPWGCGSGVNGSCNNGWIQFEICEDGLNDPNYFEQVYTEACELTAYLCKLYNLNPHGIAVVNGKEVPVITCHADAYSLGMGNNHTDINHWFPKYNKNMATVRDDVAKLLEINNNIIPVPEEEEEEEMTQEKFNEMMNNYLTALAQQGPSAWSAEARAWCEKNGIIKGDEHGNRMYKKYLTREEIATLLYRLHGQE
jgi:hypothetical protein